MGRTSTLSGVGVLKTEQSLLDDEYDLDQDSRCNNCGGEREWCSTCRMWTETCCDEFGTCQCS